MSVKVAVYNASLDNGADKIMIFPYEGLSDGTTAPDGSAGAERRRVYQKDFR